MEWWVWVLLIVVLLVLAVGIWYWMRMRAAPSAGAPTMSDGRSATMPHDHAEGHDHDHDHEHEHEHAVEAQPEAAMLTPASVAEMAALEVAVPGKADDLVLIEGIGPRIRDVLAEAEITTFSQLADMDPEQIEAVLREAKLPPTHPESWPAQARLAAEGRMDELQQMQDSLKGGR